MKYACPQCGTAYELGPEHYNQRLECQCGEKFTVSPPAEATVKGKPKADIGLIVGHIIAGLMLLIGGAIFFFAGLNYLSFQKVPDLMCSMVGLFLFLLGCIISLLGTAADKLHKIEWYLAEFYKRK